MSKVKLLEQFLQDDVNEGLFDVVTKSKAFIKNPISATKITNNGKKLAQAEIDNAANDLDYEKRKLAAKKAADQKIEAATKAGNKEAVQKIKDDQKDSAEVLTKAHTQKSTALEDKVASIKDRIDDLAKNSTLKELGSLVKTAARVKRNEVLLKGADEEEKKQLKIQMKADMEKIQDLQKGFGEYEGSEKDEKDTKKEGPKPQPESPKEKPSQGTEKTTDTSKETSASTKPEGGEPQLTTTSTSKPAEEKPKKEKPKTEEEATSEYEKASAELRSAQNDLRNNENARKKYQEKLDNIKSGKIPKKDLPDPEAEIERIKKEIAALDERIIPEDKEALSRAVAQWKEAERNMLAFKNAPKETLASLKSFKDFVNEKKFSQEP